MWISRKLFGFWSFGSIPLSSNINFSPQNWFLFLYVFGCLFYYTRSSLSTSRICSKDGSTVSFMKFKFLNDTKIFDFYAQFKKCIYCYFQLELSFTLLFFGVEMLNEQQEMEAIDTIKRPLFHIFNFYPGACNCCCPW